MEQWKSFKDGRWINNIDVENFIQTNYQSYFGDESFLETPTNKTKKVWNKCLTLLKEELDKQVLDIDTSNMAGINNFKPGYIDKKNEVIFGLQTDKPLKRMILPSMWVRQIPEEFLWNCGSHCLE